jgi:hypothetical protein
MDSEIPDTVVSKKISEKKKKNKSEVKGLISALGTKKKAKSKPIKATKTIKARKKVTATKAVKKTTKTQSARSGKK